MKDGTKIYAKPAEGRDVPLADGTAWPAEGAWVDRQDRYYRRRLADKDIVETNPLAQAEEPAAPEAPAGAVDAGSAGETGAPGGDDAGGDDDRPSGSTRRKPR